VEHGVAVVPSELKLSLVRWNIYEQQGVLVEAGLATILWPNKGWQDLSGGDWLLKIGYVQQPASQPHSDYYPLLTFFCL